MTERKIEALRTTRGQWIACFEGSGYPNTCRDTKEEAIAALKAKANA